MAYIAKGYKPTVNIAINSPSDPDLLVLDVNDQGKVYQIMNIYNEDDQAGEGPKTIETQLLSLSLCPDSIVLGDFNTHHPIWDPLAPKSAKADDLVDWANLNNLCLLNNPGEPTFNRPNLRQPSVIDLTFASDLIANKIHDWQTIANIGSDHYGVLFTIQGSENQIIDKQATITFDTGKADWPLFESTLQRVLASSNTLNSTPFLELEVATKDPISTLSDNDSNSSMFRLLDEAAQALTDAINTAAIDSIPQKRYIAISKPWWTPDLKHLRTDMTRSQRQLKSLGTAEAKSQYLIARNTYFLAIKRAKRDHWNCFLEKEDPKSIYKALAYTKDFKSNKIPGIRQDKGDLATTFKDKCEAFRAILFPSPPKSSKPNWTGYQSDNWQWPSLNADELAYCTSTLAAKGKAPGPDKINQEIVQQAYKASPKTFYRLYSMLLEIGHHPKCWKQATGAILKKPGKPDDSDPKAYRVISLLSCLGKVLERIIARRLGYLAETTTLLNKSQIGGRQKKSAIDAALLLTNHVEQNKRQRRKTSTLFLDVKGAFDHVAKNQLLSILQSLRLPANLIAWVSSFLSDRQLQLAFDGQTEGFKPITTGIPQGSPTSPILFLIYIRDLFCSTAVKFFSYIDDISLSITSTSLRKNIKILESEVKTLYDIGDQNGIRFDLVKTELIHFNTSFEKASQAKLKLPNNAIVEPKRVVKWLGIYFDSKLTFNEHVKIRVSQARATFERFIRLANIGQGLSTGSLRQLYLACIVSVADYGAPIWWKGQSQIKNLLQGLQTAASRKILGVFKTSPILPMEVEARLAPPEIRLNTTVRKYALRAIQLPTNHPIRQLFENANGTNSTNIAKSKSQYLSQLQRIRKSIYDQYSPANLETINHFLFPPWNRQTGYNIEIDQSPKEEAAIHHLALVNSNTSSDNIFIYSDASAITDSKGIGIGIATFRCQQKQQSLIRQYSINIGPEKQVYDGELEAITLAAEHASRITQRGQKIYIFADNRAALQRLQFISDEPGQSSQIRAIKAASIITQTGAKITFAWVPGHLGIYGNELADRLAKEGTKMAPRSQQTSFATIKSKIQQDRLHEWQRYLDEHDKRRYKDDKCLSNYSKRFGWHLSPKNRIPPGTKRAISSAFYQLKIGHGYFKSYLYRLGHSSTSLCECGGKETPEHLLLSCTSYSKERSELAASLNTTSRRLTLATLLHTTQGIVHTLSYISKTKIATRTWHTQREERAVHDPSTETD